MYETKLSGADTLPPLDRAEVVQEGLRAVRWSDLVARFDAVRELRARARRRRNCR
jgi:hypothetical protein